MQLFPKEPRAINGRDNDDDSSINKKFSKRSTIMNKVRILNQKRNTCGYSHAIFSGWFNSTRETRYLQADTKIKEFRCTQICFLLIDFTLTTCSQPHWNYAEFLVVLGSHLTAARFLPAHPPRVVPCGRRYKLCR